MNSNPKRTGDDEVKLYNQIVLPAERRFNEAYGQTLHDAKDKIFGPSKKVLARKKMRNADEGASESKGLAPTSSSSQKGRASAPDPGPSKPEVVLDGSGIPKELEFKGKPSKSKPRPVVSTRPAETVTPAPVPAASGGVNELEFSGGKKKK